jgi:hypothetical protein
VKLLYWLGDGLAIWYRRLEEGTFAFPRAAGEKGLSWSRAVGEHGLEIRAAVTEEVERLISRCGTRPTGRES